MDLQNCLYTTIHSKDDCLVLQEDLNRLQLWADTWQMSFNPEKHEIIRIANIKHPIVHDYTIQEKKIKVTSSVKYLGVYIDDHLTWKDHINHVYS